MEEENPQQTHSNDISSQIARKQIKVTDTHEISYVSNIFSLLQSSDLPFALTEKEDIIKDIYEGGFKVWECTIDLLAYLGRINFDFTNKTVMDLGCGHGLLGIYALQRNASTVLFQDFNYEVLSIAVRINLSLNGLLGSADLQNKLIFLSGDWSHLPQKIAAKANEIQFFETKLAEYANQFDVLMLSEVIYNQANYEKIAIIITALLKADGVCFLANKLYYFGVGGSMPEFKQYLAQNHSHTLIVESLEIVNNKKGNKREIIAVKKK